MEYYDNENKYVHHHCTPLLLAVSAVRPDCWAAMYALIVGHQHCTPSLLVSAVRPYCWPSALYALIVGLQHCTPLLLVRAVRPYCWAPWCALVAGNLLL